MKNSFTDHADQSAVLNTGKHAPLKAIACVQNNGPDYWIVSAGYWKAHALATCSNEADAIRIAAALNRDHAFEALLEACKWAFNDSAAGELKTDTLLKLQQAIKSAEPFTH